MSQFSLAGFLDSFVGRATTFAVALGSALIGGTGARAQGYTLTTLASFNGTNGANPYVGLTLASNGNLYGTTDSGGAHGDGTVYEIAAGTSAITTLASFNFTDGANPYAALTLASNGDLYGTTEYGGSNGGGTVYEIATGTSAITTLASFSGENGDYIEAGLIQDSNGNLFGTTGHGGANNDGTVFELASSANAATTLAVFNGANGANVFGGLTFGSNGTLYGTTATGGANGDGTVFELTPTGSATAPEPGALALLVAAMPVGFVVRRRRRRLSQVTGRRGFARAGDAYRVARMLAVLCGVSSLMSSATQSFGQVIVNPGFETPALPLGGIDPLASGTGVGWTFQVDAGITANDSGFTFGNPNAPQGSQVGYIHYHNDDVGDFFQTISGFTGGSYVFSFDAAQRAAGADASQVTPSDLSFDILIDGGVLETFQPDSTNYALYTTAPTFLSAGQHTLTFQALSPSETAGTLFAENPSDTDTAVFLDSVSVSNVTAPEPTVLDLMVTLSGVMTVAKLVHRLKRDRRGLGQSLSRA